MADARVADFIGWLGEWDVLTGGDKGTGLMRMQEKLDGGKRREREG